MCIFSIQSTKIDFVSSDHSICLLANISILFFRMPRGITEIKKKKSRGNFLEMIKFLVSYNDELEN